MRLLSIHEPSFYSNATLHALAVRMQSALAALPEGSIERDNALTNLRIIRRVLANRQPQPG